MRSFPRALALAAALAAVAAGCAPPPTPAVPAALGASAMGPAGAARPPNVSGGASLRYATYAWNADDVVTRWHAGTLWTLLRAKHVDAVLLGFDDAQIAKYSTRAGTAQMNAMIAQARAHGTRVELLLGDPHWIVPAGIPGLLRILHRLHAVSFAELDLDLEPNQVRGQPVRAVVKQLVTAMKAYVGASAWPVSLDVNYIYVNAGSKSGFCFMCGLRDAGVHHVNLMTYISTPATVVEKDGPLLAQYPWMQFSIAQSVEPPGVLPPWDSYWDDGFSKFYADMQSLDAKLRTVKNYAGITIESLPYLETMGP